LITCWRLIKNNSCVIKLFPNNVRRPSMDTLCLWYTKHTICARWLPIPNHMCSHLPHDFWSS
jgi:hypothetical protein